MKTIGFEMPVTIDWVNANKQTLLCNASGDLSSDDVRVAFHKVRRKIIDTGHIVHTLLDIQHASNMPGNFMPMLAHHLNAAPKNAGLFILLGDNSYTSSLVVTFWRVYPLEIEKIKMAATIEDALVLIDASV